MALVAAMSLCGCSVKEDRSICPCILTLDLTELDDDHLSEMEVEKVIFDCVGTGCLVPGRIPKEMEREVSRDVLRRSFHCIGAGWNVTEGLDSLMIPVGAQCPPIYSSSDSLDARREVLRDTVHLHKNFARLKIKTDFFPTDSFGFCLVGTVCGYSASGQPLAGPFEYRFMPDREGMAEISVPRQTDDALRMETGHGNFEFRSLPLGKYIERSGYDWTAEDLTDIEIEVGLTSTRISFSTGQWGNTQLFSVLI